MSTFINILLALLILSLIIVFHEFGHFVFARINGVAVDEFSLGMGPKLLSKKFGSTVYSLKLFPIGGSCMMKGENGDAADEKGAEDSFNSKNVWQRLSIVLAGPVFNFILSFILALFIIGMAGYDPAEVTYITEDGASEAAGLQEGDIITEINGKNIVIGRDIYNYLYFNTLDEKDVKLTVERDGKEMEITVTPEPVTHYYMGISYYNNPGVAEITVMDDYPAQEAGLRNGDVITSINGVSIKTGEDMGQYFQDHPLDGSEITLTYTRNDKSHELSFTPIWSTTYAMGFGYNMGREKTDIAGVVRYSFTEVRYWMTTTVHSLFYMVTGHVKSEDMGGAVRIVSEMSDTVEASKPDGAKYVFLNLVYWAILISANLGVMNLLPIPALDGGRIFFMIIEIIRGKPIPPEKEAMVHFIGFILLMILMVLILYNDIRNVFF